MPQPLLLYETDEEQRCRVIKADNKLNKKNKQMCSSLSVTAPDPGTSKGRKAGNRKCHHSMSEPTLAF